MDLNNIRLCDLTVTEFIGIVLSLLFIIFMFYMMCQIICIILDILFFFIRKDKYRTRRDLLYIYALKDMAKHRKQVRNAPTEKAFYLYYNRMIGAYESYVTLGVFKDDVCTKLLDVRGVYVWRERNKNNEEFEEHTEINPNN